MFGALERNTVRCGLLLWAVNFFRSLFCRMYRFYTKCIAFISSYTLKCIAFVFSLPIRCNVLLLSFPLMLLHCFEAKNFYLKITHNGNMVYPLRIIIIEKTFIFYRRNLTGF